MPEPLADLDAEETVLGACLLSEGAVRACLPELEGEHFYRASHGVIFETMRMMFLAAGPVDVVTIVAALTESGRLEEAGGRVRLHELAALVPSASNALHYARIVKERWAQRQVHRLLFVNSAALVNGETSLETMRALETGLITIRGLVEKGQSSTVTALTAASYLAQKITDDTPEEQGIVTPWSFTGKLVGGRLYILGGYQADGKSQASIQFVEAAATQPDRVVRTGIVSMEMPWRDVADRMLSAHGLNATRVQRGNLRPDEVPRAMNALGKIARWPVDIIDDPRADTVAIRRYQKLARYDLLVIDHLHQFQTRSEYRRQDVEAILQELTTIAREENIPILLLVQLSRSSDKKRPFPRPTLASIRETGMAEALASVVWFVWRKRDDRNLVLPETEWICAKNRYGRTGHDELRFDDSALRFVEVERQREAA